MVRIAAAEALAGLAAVVTLASMAVVETVALALPLELAAPLVVAAAESAFSEVPTPPGFAGQICRVRACGRMGTWRSFRATCSPHATRAS